MTTYAKCRQYEKGERFLFVSLDGDYSELQGSIECSAELYECWQPDCINDDEFNLVIMLNGFPVKARGCHFDFVEVPNE